MAMKIYSLLMVLSLFIPSFAASAENEDIDELKQTADMLRIGDLGGIVLMSDAPKILTQQEGLAVVYHRLAGLTYAEVLASGQLREEEERTARKALEKIGEDALTVLRDAAAVTVDASDVEMTGYWSRFTRYVNSNPIRRNCPRNACVMAVRGGRKLDRSFNKKIGKLNKKVTAVSREIASAEDAQERAKLRLRSAGLYGQLASASMAEVVKQQSNFLRNTATTLRAGEGGLEIRTPLPDGGWSKPRMWGRAKSLAFIYNQLAAREFGDALQGDDISGDEKDTAEKGLSFISKREEALLKDAAAVTVQQDGVEKASYWGQVQAYVNRYRSRRFRIRTPTAVAAVRGGRKIDTAFNKKINDLDARALKTPAGLKRAAVYSEMASAAITASVAAPVSQRVFKDKIAKVATLPPVRSGGELKAKQIYKKAGPGVVLVLCRGKGKSGELGTGSVINAEGYILTNAHVVLEGETQNPFKSIRVYFKPNKLTGDPKRDLSNPVTAEVVKVDSGLDLAVLKLKNPPSGLTVLPLGDADSVSPGDPVSAIGHPEQGGLWTLTTGVISTVLADFGGVLGKDIFQTDASINRGNSGGPLLDSRGNIIGVNTSMARRAPDGLAITSVNFAVKSSVVKKWLGGVEIKAPVVAKKPVAKPAVPAAKPRKKKSKPRQITPKKPYKRDSIIAGMKEMEDMMGDMRDRMRGHRKRMGR